MKKLSSKLLCLFLLCALMISCLGFTASAVTSSDEEKIVVDRVTAYLDSLDAALVEGELDSNALVEYFLADNDESYSTYNTEKVVTEVQIENRNLYKFDIRYSKIESEYSLEDIAITGDAAKVTVLKSETRWYYDDRSPEDGYDNPHTFSLIKYDGTWYILTHDYSNEFKDMLERTVATSGVDLETAKDQYLADAAKIFDGEYAEMERIIEEYGSVEAYCEKIDADAIAELESSDKAGSGTKSYSYHSYDHADGNVNPSV